mmetsp:Transcript_118793/g.378921  ORF Transcript_118793/g.378921 Transcript_118793/m.378921 type:complete len:472 (-) Transcript_118793:62-1477(-)
MRDVELSSVGHWSSRQSNEYRTQVRCKQSSSPFDGADAGVSDGSAAKARGAPSPTTFDSRERLQFWRSVLENAAASEVAVNVCLPCFVCAHRAGVWEAPSEAVLSSIVLVLNLVGCFLEGFFKSTRLLSQTMRRSQVANQLVFITSQGVSEGFLNVLTSFPDISGSAATVALSQGTVRGVLYCIAQLLGGIAVYRLGRDVGWSCAQRHWPAVLRFCGFWPIFCRGLVLVSFLAMVVLGPGSSAPPARGGGAVGLAGVEASPGGASSSPSTLPLDLHAPHLQGLANVRIVYDEYTFTVPPLALGLLVGIAMSASGAVVATLFCSVLFPESSRPFARFATNLAATVLTLLAQARVDPSDWRSFVVFKFATSFCGALSAFSGTVGDIVDAYWGSAAEETSVDRVMAKKGWLPLISAAQNLFAHLSLTLVVMFITMASDAVPREIFAVGAASTQLRPWIREQESFPWHLDVASEV